MEFSGLGKDEDFEWTPDPNSTEMEPYHRPTRSVNDKHYHKVFFFNESIEYKVNLAKAASLPQFANA